MKRPELQKMHEIFGNPNCGTAARYQDGTCSKIIYDPAEMSFRERMEKQPPTEQPTEVEKEAKRVLQFTNLINPKTRRT